MTLICYDKSLRFQAAARETLDQANAIIAEYHAKGFSMTLRQLYYQFVARKLVKENTLAQYKRLGDIISRGRIAGLIHWEAIADNTRFLRREPYWADKEYLPYLEDAANGFNIDLWSTQKYRPEVWIEKDALVGVISNVCEKWEVPYFAARGYSSQSEQWRAGLRLRKWKNNGYEPIIFHLGDHDPSGIDMTRDNESRLWMFGGHVEVHRLALNFDQVKQYNPPPMPVKPKDARTVDYKRTFGTDECWELDALDPTIIEELVEKAILSILDQEAFNKRKAELVEQRKEIVALVDTLKPYNEEDPYVWR